MNNKSIGKCEFCGQDYCMECSDNKNWEKFCSGECEERYKEENKQYAISK